MRAEVELQVVARVSMDGAEMDALHDALRRTFVSTDHASTVKAGRVSSVDSHQLEVVSDFLEKLGDARADADRLREQVAEMRGVRAE